MPEAATMQFAGSAIGGSGAGAYLRLIEEGRPPYVDVVQAAVKDIERHVGSKEFREVTVHTINVEHLRRSLEEQNVEVSPHCIGRTLRAFFFKVGFREGEDFYVSRSGRMHARFHIELDMAKLELLRAMSMTRT